MTISVFFSVKVAPAYGAVVLVFYTLAALSGAVGFGGLDLETKVLLRTLLSCLRRSEACCPPLLCLILAYVWKSFGKPAVSFYTFIFA